MIFVLGASSDKKHVILIENPIGDRRPSVDDPNVECWEYAGDPNGGIASISRERASRAYYKGIQAEGMGGTSCQTESFATMAEVWAWIKKHQRCECARQEDDRLRNAWNDSRNGGASRFAAEALASVSKES